MRRLTFIKRVPLLLKLVVIVAVLSTGIKLGLAYADNSYTASGTVTIGGNPLPNAGGDQVSLSSNNGDGAGGNSSVSDGNYSIGGLPNDDYNASVTGGNASQLVVSIGSTAPVVTVNGADVTQNLAFNTVNDTVTVKDGNGNPVSGSQVYVTSTDGAFTDSSGNGWSGNVQGAGVTGSDGTVTIAIIPGTNYQVCAFTASQNEYCDSITTINSNTTAEVDFPLSYTVSGTVTVGGNLLPNAGDDQISLSSTSGDGAGGNSSISNGNYSVSGLPNDSYNMSVTGGNSSQLYVSLGSTTPVVTVDGANVTQNLAFNTYNDTVTVKDGNGNPVSGSQVYVTSTSGTFTDSSGNDYSGTVQGAGVTSSDGTVAIAVIPGTNYQVCAYTVSQNEYCDSITTINSDTTATVNFPLSYTASGTVTIGGNPLPNAGGDQVSLSSNNGDGAGGNSSVSDGNYSIGGLPNDDYNASVTGGNASQLVVSIGSTAPVVTVNGADVTQNLAFNTVNDTVTVKDGNGNPVSGSQVYVTSTDGAFTDSSGNGWSGNVQGAGVTGSDGTVTIAIIPGTNYQVCAFTASQNEYCDSITTINSNTTATVYLEPIPSAPTNLTIPSPTNAPVLTWTGVSGANSYNIYANGTLIGSTSSTTYTDNSPTIGNDTYYVTAVNLAGESAPSNNVNVTVTNGTTPTITSAASYSTGMRQPITPSDFTVTTTGTPTPAITENGTLPSGITFTDNGNGTANFTGQAATGTNGTYPITITASNGVGTAATQSFTLTITTATSAPAFTSTNSVTVAYGVAMTPFTVTTSGYPAPALTERSALPSGLTFHDNGDGTATISGTPSGNADGAYTLTLSGNNNIGTRPSQTFTIYVNKVASFNTIGSNALIATTGTAYSLTVSTTGYPAPAMTESGTLPSGLSFTDNGNGTATIAGTPGSTTGGTYSITVTGTNSSGATNDTFTITVHQAPAFTSASSVTVAYGVAMTPFTVTTSGYPAPALTERSALPSGLTFHDNGDGTATISGTPDGNANGTYTLTLTANNSVGTRASQTFTITVTQ